MKKKSKPSDRDPIEELSQQIRDAGNRITKAYEYLVEDFKEFDDVFPTEIQYPSNELAKQEFRILLVDSLKSLETRVRKSFDGIKPFMGLLTSKYFESLLAAIKKAFWELDGFPHGTQWKEVAPNTVRRGRTVFTLQSGKSILERFSPASKLSPTKEALHAERDLILSQLTGVFTLQKATATRKSKKNRDAKAIDKEKDLLYLLDQYESWQAKEAEKTGRKRFNAKEWLQEYDQWKSKAKAIWGKHVKTKSRDGTSQEVDPSSKIAQGRIDSIIKYAQKIKRERSERGK